MNSGFDFGKLFTAGVAYLSHAEESWASDREARMSKTVKEDVQLDDEAARFVIIPLVFRWFNASNPQDCPITSIKKENSAHVYKYR